MFANRFSFASGIRQSGNLTPVLFAISMNGFLCDINSFDKDIDVIGDFTKLEPSQASQNALKNVISCGQEAEVLSRSADITTDPEMKGNAFFEMIE
ncbi:hypothetical protein LSH36_1807g00000 [Paralvinella palmiformis]|uniref:Uncharacterized protein n=1 Tax=Paralvinella palmiformis TaxID=53620 RepID=A0AAD9ISE9_9ANNE|nr:hypothetical protein LSH36_1807g00000 [Paralvinella palmiformis]